jgi:hypothetical protein
VNHVPTSATRGAWPASMIQAASMRSDTAIGELDAKGGGETVDRWRLNTEEAQKGPRKACAYTGSLGEVSRVLTYVPSLALHNTSTEGEISTCVMLGPAQIVQQARLSQDHLQASPQRRTMAAERRSAGRA